MELTRTEFPVLFTGWGLTVMVDFTPDPIQ